MPAKMRIEATIKESKGGYMAIKIPARIRRLPRITITPPFL